MAILCFVVGYLFGFGTVCLLAFGGDDDGK